MAGDMDLLVRSLSAVSRLLASSPLSKHISSSLVADVQWWTMTLVDLGVISGSRVVCKSTVKSDVPCSMCKGTGDWHERGVPAFGAKWLKCPRCKGERTEAIDNLVAGRKAMVGDESLIVVDFSNDHFHMGFWNDVPSRLRGGCFDCPTLSEAGSALAALVDFTLSSVLHRGRSDRINSGPFVLDLSCLLDFGCTEDLSCDRLGGVINSHVGLLVNACECWHGGRVRGDNVVPAELHDWLWIERAIRVPFRFGDSAYGLSGVVGVRGAEELRKHYSRKRIRSWLDGVSR